MEFNEFLIDRLEKDVLQKLRNHYLNKSVVVTGGASFIGSHLVDVLIFLGSEVTVLDDLSSGKKEFVSNKAKFINVDLAFREAAQQYFHGADIVFHLAAIHGGRGFIETQHRAMLTNLAIDNNVYEAALNSGVEMIVNASSACAYPVNLQSDANSRKLLAEDFAGMGASEKSFPDGVYGWIKLMGEFQLENYVSNSDTKGRSARIFTAYGDRENESHAAIALIAKALLRIEPFPVWGNGMQTRNFTYVSDTVTGLLLLASDTREMKFDVFNIGTSEHVTVIDFIEEIFSELSWRPKNFDFDLSKPVGVASRASDNTKIFEIFGWKPEVSISEGIHRTVKWYVDLADRPKTLIELNRKLMAR